VYKSGARAAKARVIYTISVGSIPEAINNALGVRAHTMTLQNTCCAGMDAVGYAANLVATGEADIAICGGTEAPLHRFPLLELRAAGLTPSTTEMPERIGRPFDRWRTTGVISEGATMLVLEPESSPRRGYSYVSGYAFANDAPDALCSGMAIATKLALAAANCRPAQVDAINAWGPGHPLVDLGEARAMAQVFSSRLPVSIKGSIGNPLGAASSIQIAAAALAQQSGIMPPTVNWEYPDPACPFNLSNRARLLEHETTLVNSHGLAGVNSAIVLERC
jgi:3-oxoacyl-[acyl-carrier-protein] synthase II